MKTGILLISLVVFFFSAAVAQDIEGPHSHEAEEHHKDDHHSNEIGLANSVVYVGEEGGVHYGLHAHYTRMIPGIMLGFGAGYERIFDEHGHNTFSAVLLYKPVHRLNLVLSPGVVFEDEEPSELGFALHLESSYEFPVGDFHIGPAAEFAYDIEDYHFSLGIHVGYGF